MGSPTPDLERFLSPSFLEGIEERTMEELRATRAEVQQAEVAVSYVRRVVQGRLDIVSAESRRRAEGSTADGGAEETAAIVGDLPGILADPGHSGRTSGPGRLPMHIDPGQQADDLVADVDREVDPTKLTEISSLSDAEMDVVAESLRNIERQLSDQRHALHERLDALQAEMVRRYRTGGANVDDLLN